MEPKYLLVPEVLGDPLLEQQAHRGHVEHPIHDLDLRRRVVRVHWREQHPPVGDQLSGGPGHDVLISMTAEDETGLSTGLPVAIDIFSLHWCATCASVRRLEDGQRNRTSLSSFTAAVIAVTNGDHPLGPAPICRGGRQADMDVQESHAGAC